jgi:hypothetical protein
MAGSGTDTGASLTLADLTGLPDEAARRQDVYDATGNIMVDYTLFGFEKTQ